MFGRIITLCLLVGVAIGYTSPRSASIFHHVLERSKLQAPDSSTVAYKPYDVAERFFHLEDDTYLTFQMNGEGHRSELRQTDTDEDESEWSVKDFHRLTAEVSLPVPASEMEEFTFLQVHCGVKPALRVVWMREYDGVGDAIFAVLRMNDKDGDDIEVERYPLGQRSSEETQYTVTVDDSRIVIEVNGDQVQDLDAEFWEDAECYFKAGAYIQHQEGDDAEAITRFSHLQWD